LPQSDANVEVFRRVSKSNVMVSKRNSSEERPSLGVSKCNRNSLIENEAANEDNKKNSASETNNLPTNSNSSDRNICNVESTSSNKSLNELHLTDKVLDPNKIPPKMVACENSVTNSAASSALEENDQAEEGQLVTSTPHKLSLKEWSANSSRSNTDDVLCTNAKGVYTKAHRDILLKNGHISFNDSNCDGNNTSAASSVGVKTPLVNSSNLLDNDGLTPGKSKQLMNIDIEAASAVPRSESDYSPIWKYSSRVARAHNSYSNKKEVIYETVYPTDQTTPVEEQSTTDQENPPPLPPRTKSLKCGTPNGVHKPLERCMALPLSVSRRGNGDPPPYLDRSSKQTNGTDDAKKMNGTKGKVLDGQQQQYQIKHKSSCSRRGPAVTRGDIVSRTSSGGESVQSEPSVRPKQPHDGHMSVNRGESLPYAHSNKPDAQIYELNAQSS